MRWGTGADAQPRRPYRLLSPQGPCLSLFSRGERQQGHTPTPKPGLALLMTSLVPCKHSDPVSTLFFLGRNPFSFSYSNWGGGGGGGFCCLKRNGSSPLPKSCLEPQPQSVPQNLSTSPSQLDWLSSGVRGEEASTVVWLCFPVCMRGSWL